MGLRSYILFIGDNGQLLDMVIDQLIDKQNVHYAYFDQVAIVDWSYEGNTGLWLLIESDGNLYFETVDPSAGDFGKFQWYHLSDVPSVDSGHHTRKILGATYYDEDGPNPEHIESLFKLYREGVADARFSISSEDSTSDGLPYD